MISVYSPLHLWFFPNYPHLFNPGTSSRLSSCVWVHACQSDVTISNAVDNSVIELFVLFGLVLLFMSHTYIFPSFSGLLLQLSFSVCVFFIIFYFLFQIYTFHFFGDKKMNVVCYFLLFYILNHFSKLNVIIKSVTPETLYLPNNNFPFPAPSSPWQLVLYSLLLWVWLL